ncbi:hypothetical protein K0B04_01010 [Patescibacteria group bacterium]|nr:hypothetical protein [Patescibacteria group bacterium]
MKKKKWLYYVFGLFILVLAVIYIISRIIHGNVESRLNRGIANLDFDWKVPTLPNSYQWEERKPSEEEMNIFSIVYDDRYLNVDNPTINNIQSDGKVYIAEIGKSVFQSDETGWELFDANFKKQLEDNNWLIGRKYDSYYISGVKGYSQDNDLTSSYQGYVKTNGYFVRTFIYYFEKGQESTTLKVFISDNVDLRNHLTDIK